eukprot:1339846-Pleurochrysis_carterae.AAC.2
MLRAPTSTTENVNRVNQILLSSFVNVVSLYAYKLATTWPLAMTRDKTRFTKRSKSVPQRDAVATDESAADRRAKAQIDRSSTF